MKSLSLFALTSFLTFAAFAAQASSELSGSVSELNAPPTKVRISVFANEFQNLGHPDAVDIAKGKLKNTGLRICAELGGSKIKIKDVQVKQFYRDGTYAAASGLLTCLTTEGRVLEISEQALDKYQDGDEQSLSHDWPRYTKNLVE